MTHHKDMISTEEARIMLLEQKNNDFHQTLVRIEKKLDHLDTSLDLLNKKFETKIDGLDTKFEAKIDALDKKLETKFDALDRKFDTKIDALDRKFDTKIDALDRKFEIKIDSQNNKMDSHFRWTIGFIFGLYATALATLLGAVGNAYHWF